ncbi:MAG: hypothetical protein JJ992_13030, partial [Planctomycetes bacterium]|nr:hypothetical protein [Planctomycetota bacterium]
IDIPGNARSRGVWMTGASGWNRIIYDIADATGELYRSVGTKDAWNCDDIFSWSSANFDGWRYVRFPLPGNAPGDNYREADSTWWGSDEDGVVDLPVQLTRIIVEMRPQMIYVNDMLPVEDLTLAFDDLSAEYEEPEDMTEAPVKLQIAAAGMLTDGKLMPLPNPHQELLESGWGPPPKIADMRPPDQINNGRRLFVTVQPVAGAVRYRGYVSAYPDGRGAQPLAAVGQQAGQRVPELIGKPTTLYYDGLLPSRPMYLFVSAVDEQGRESKPSDIRQVVLKDEFPFK